MAKGNRIVVSARPLGREIEGTISGTPKPGQFVQIKAGEAFTGGRPVFEPYNPVAGDGGRPQGPLIILTENVFIGKTKDDAYVDGSRCFAYIPQPGDELNVLFKNISGTGTGDECAIGDVLTLDAGTGKAILSDGSSESPSSPEIEPLVAMEDEMDVTEDVHIHCMFSGY